MVNTPELEEIEEWNGVLGPQSSDEPMFYEIQISNQEVTLVGPSPGMVYKYDIDEFTSLVANGEWILAEDNPEKEVFHTPDGQPDQPY